jgi:hypothetical protein
LALRLRRAGEDPGTLCREHGIEGAGELPGTVPDQELDRCGALAEVPQEVTRCLCRPRAVGVRGGPGQVSAAGAVLDDDQRVDAPQEHGVHVHEVSRQDAAGLRGQELLPGRAAAAGRGIDPGSVQDLPHRGRRDPVTELDQLPLHPPVTPRRVLRRDADHQFADRGCRGRPSRTPPAGVVPFTGDQPPVPGEQSRRCHREHFTPAVAGDELGQCREPQPVTRLVADPADLTAQHRVLMTQDQQLGVPGHRTPGQHHQAAEHAAHKQVDNREDHPAMISARWPARSSNRAPQALATPIVPVQRAPFASVRQINPIYAVD